MIKYFQRLLEEKFPWLEQFLRSHPHFNKLRDSSYDVIDSLFLITYNSFIKD